MREFEGVLRVRIVGECVCVKSGIGNCFRPLKSAGSRECQLQRLSWMLKISYFFFHISNIPNTSNTFPCRCIITCPRLNYSKPNDVTGVLRQSYGLEKSNLKSTRRSHCTLYKYTCTRVIESFFFFFFNTLYEYNAVLNLIGVCT